MVRFARRLDGDSYHASVRWRPGGSLKEADRTYMR